MPRTRRVTLQWVDPTISHSDQWHASSQDQRVKGLTKCLQMARDAGHRDCVIMGDMNTEFFPGSGVEKLLAARLEADVSDDLLRKECAASLRLGGEDFEEGEGGEMTGEIIAGEPTEQQMSEWVAMPTDAHRSHRPSTLDKITPHQCSQE